MAQAIIDKIISDAEEKAKCIIAEAEKKANSIVEQSESYANNQRDVSIREQKAEAKLFIDRKKTVAKLDVKKLFLKKKQEIITKVFSDALVKIKGSTKAYQQIIEQMLSKAENDDTVYISASDKDFITEEFINNYAKKRGIVLHLGEKYRDIFGGIIISSVGYDKNLALEVELATMKDEVLSEVAEILFN